MAKSTSCLGKAKYVLYGYGQVEPNHLSAPRNGQVYAQLPADPAIDILENGQFVHYDYAAGLCKLGAESKAPWMMVFNEVKVYGDREGDADFAMKKSDYNARVYSPIGQTTSTLQNIVNYGASGFSREGSTEPYSKQIETFAYPAMMPGYYDTEKMADPKANFKSAPFINELKKRATMVPRVFRISVGDIWTTNTILDANTDGEIKAGAYLKIDPTTGLLTKDAEGPTAQGGDSDPIIQIIKVYTTPDLQPAVKVTRIG